jgi:cytochrome c-type biogenesis protein CcmH
MVRDLAERLKENPNDLKGWRMLRRSYLVLGETEKARAVEARLKALTGGASGSP